MPFNGQQIRKYFPSLSSKAIFFDNPGGTQVAQAVIDAMEKYFLTANANSHGAFATSQKTDMTIKEARQAFADFLNAASPNEIVFGANMTTNTFNISRALGRNIKKGDEIILTRMDHDANVAPWLALQEKGAVIKWVDIIPEDCTLNLTEYKKLLSPRTKIVAVGGASNAVGTINDIKTITSLAHKKGALVFVDAVQLAPHAPIDVQDWDCDLLTCSAYKFFGPHIGILYGKLNLLKTITPFKVRPAGNEPPHKFETGTQNHEGIAGALAAINYLAFVGKKYGQPFAKQFSLFSGRRLHLKTAMATIQAYEKTLSEQLVTGLKKINGITIYGITDFKNSSSRVPTVAFNLSKVPPRKLAESLGKNNIYVWDGNYYAYELMAKLGLEASGGAVRVGLAHYNTYKEITKFLTIIRKINKG